MKTMKLIYIGEHFYHDSATLMSCLYTAGGIRSDWSKVQAALQAGETVEIRPATQEERERYELHLLRINGAS